MALATVVASCHISTPYSHYESVPTAGWEKNDTISFGVPPIATAGKYKEEVGLRVSGDYPFMSLTLIVEQTVIPTFQTRRDTLSCLLVDKEANQLGRGVTRFQHRFHLTTLALNEGDSLHIDIRHNMKREMLPGVSDVGITLSEE